MTHLLIGFIVAFVLGLIFGYFPECRSDEPVRKFFSFQALVWSLGWVVLGHVVGLWFIPIMFLLTGIFLVGMDMTKNYKSMRFGTSLVLGAASVPGLLIYGFLTETYIPWVADLMIAFGFFVLAWTVDHWLLSYPYSGHHRGT